LLVNYSGYVTGEKCEVEGIRMKDEG
jgi:hypothetical protein